MSKKQFCGLAISVFALMIVLTAAALFGWGETPALVSLKTMPEDSKVFLIGDGCQIADSELSCQFPNELQAADYNFTVGCRVVENTWFCKINQDIFNTPTLAVSSARLYLYAEGNWYKIATRKESAPAIDFDATFPAEG